MRISRTRGCFPLFVRLGLGSRAGEPFARERGQLPSKREIIAASGQGKQPLRLAPTKFGNLVHGRAPKLQADKNLGRPQLPRHCKFGTEMYQRGKPNQPPPSYGNVPISRRYSASGTP